MPFGLSTCPSTFMRYISAIFRHLISKSIVLPYMDDVVIPAANESQALEYLKIVLEDIEIAQILKDEITAQFQEQRDALRQDAKKQIYKVLDENRRTYNLRRRQAHKYQLHDLVAIKRTQFGPGLKLKQKYLGPYKVTKVKHNDTYDVEKCDFVDGPSKTSTCAELMKLWPSQTNST
ncbi:transposon Ty3-I Gag-Pol polyprotein [Trichonephila clavipes]|nr:transposon Ty3-I Gag-Pol polyprotein [Trichonephila clavipes]